MEQEQTRCAHTYVEGKRGNGYRNNTKEKKAVTGIEIKNDTRHTTLAEYTTPHKEHTGTGRFDCLMPAR